MTRVFGFERGMDMSSHVPNGAKEVFDNLQEAIGVTYEKGWQAYGMGFIVVNEKEAKSYPVFLGYQGLTTNSQVLDHIPEALHLDLANNPRAFFGVLQNRPDNGEDEFSSHLGWEFPLQSENWLVITMGSWWNDDFNDEDLPWYNPERPSTSIIRYLESSPENINFDWVDPRRTPYIIAVKKDGSCVHVTDKYSDNNENGLSYVRNEADGLILHQGVRNSEGELV